MDSPDLDDLAEPDMDSLDLDDTADLVSADMDSLEDDPADIDVVQDTDLDFLTFQRANDLDLRVPASLAMNVEPYSSDYDGIRMNIASSDMWPTRTDTANPRSYERQHVNTELPPSETILNTHDYAELQSLEEHPETSPSNILQDLLSRHSHLDLSGRVHEIGTVQRNFGGYSDIFIGYYLPSNCDARVKVAVKRLRVNIMDDAKFQKSLAKELYIWSKLDHTNILRLEGFFLGDEQFPQLVSKWMENGTVLNFLNTHPSAGVLNIISGIGQGIEYLHSNQIVHSDIKPDNIMISESGQPLLCDFGVSRMLSTSTTMQISSTMSGRLRGTLRFMSKEMIMPTDSAPTPYTTESDVWAFGMTVYTILTKRVPYYNLNIDAQVMLAIVQGSLPLRPDDIDSWPIKNQIVWRIIEFCWRAPSDRPSISTCTSELILLEYYLEELHSGAIYDTDSYRLWSLEKLASQRLLCL